MDVPRTWAGRATGGPPGGARADHTWICIGGSLCEDCSRSASTAFAVLNETNLVCDANSGLVNLAGGLVVGTQSDLPHVRRMIELSSKVWAAMPWCVALTHEDIDHVAENQLFPDAEIIAHRTMPVRMKQAADPAESQKLTNAVRNVISRGVLVSSSTSSGLTASFATSRWTRPRPGTYRRSSTACITSRRGKACRWSSD